MCDYSLGGAKTRPAKVSDKLTTGPITTTYGKTSTRGFTAVGEPDVAVCLLPGTEVAFDRDVAIVAGAGIKPPKERVARFRQINKEASHAHHDGLEFPDGQFVLLNNFVEGQKATVLQLPVIAMPDGSLPADAPAEARRLEYAGN